MQPIDIDPRDLETARDILSRHVPEREVWAFGSRVTWTAKDFSDLDLAVMGDQPLPTSVMADLEEAFRESDLPFKVDVVDWAVTSDNFRQIIETEYVVVQKGGRKSWGMADDARFDPTGDTWPVRTIGSLITDGLADLQTGPFGTLLQASAYRAEGTPVVAVRNIAENRLTDEQIPRVDAETVNRLSEYRLRSGDILFCRKGYVDRRALVRREQHGWLQGSDCIRLRMSAKGADPAFVSYTIGAPVSRDWLLRNAHGATMPSLNQEIIARLPIPVPPPDQQRAIAHVLGTFDDKIELNRRMSETLEAMARALFKSWFVDFDPVRAKAEGRDPGLPEPLADLFPDSFEASELGKIPKGWRILPLAECVDAARGLSYKGSGLSDSGLPMHNLNSIYEGGGYKHEGIKHYEGDYRPHHVARAGDLIVANTVQGHNRLLIGYAAIVPTRFDGESLFSHHIYRVRPRSSSGLTPDYLCHLLNTSVMHDTVSGYANGKTVNMLPIDGLQRPLVVVPPSGIVRAFDGFAEAARKRHGEMMDESRTLAALRDALLPKLISGKIHVDEAARIAARGHPELVT